jgi:signal transduction histidine kinase
MIHGAERLARAGSGVESVGITASALRDAAGKIIAGIEVVRDLADRKSAEVALLDYQEQLKSLAAELSIAEEKERRRIASELHDQIGQTLALAKIKLDSLACPSMPAGCRKTIAEVKGLVDQTIQEVRSLTSQISPPILYEVGLEAALEWLGDRLLADYGLRVKCRDDQQPKLLSAEMRSTLFQSVRELLLNVVKHAKINEATLSSERIHDRIAITVEDLGRGFVMADAGRKRNSGGFGLFNIRQRVEHLGGEMLVESGVGRGIRVTLSAPLG